MSRKLGPTWRSASPWADGLRDEHVGEHVRQVAEHRDETVVGLGVERHWPRPHGDHEPVQALVEQALGLRQRGQVPDRAVEEIGPGVLDPRGLGARYRVAADEARVVDRREQLLLGRPYVGDERPRAGDGQRLMHQRG
jgi:hypothetical protein